LRGFIIDISERKEWELQHIKDYVAAVSELTERLMRIARGGRLQFETADLNQVIRDETELFSGSMTAENIRFNIDDTKPPVSIDRIQFGQVLLNLLLNARQAAGDEPAEILMRTSCRCIGEREAVRLGLEAGSYVIFSVADMGRGIEAEILDKISDPFFTTKEDGQGSGLGLASVYGIIKNHKGQITAESEAGKGSTFTVYLPVQGVCSTSQS
jgi:signal transduction histidine kinase